MNTVQEEGVSPLTTRSGLTLVRIRMFAAQVVSGGNPNPTRAEVLMLASAYREVERENAVLKATITALLDHRK